VRIVKNGVFVAIGYWSKTDVYFLSNGIEVALLLFYPMGLQLTSSVLVALVSTVAIRIPSIHPSIHNRNIRDSFTLLGTGCTGINTYLSDCSILAFTIALTLPYTYVLLAYQQLITVSIKVSRVVLVLRPTHRIS
jgi:hypothetical protein